MATAEARTAVPAGSVALAGRFSAVYPRRSPGGWQLIGHTDAPLWDVDREEPALIRPGDTVRYRAVRELVTVSSETALPASRRERKHALMIEDPGMQSLPQDRGRPGRGDLGVVASGAADRASAARLDLPCQAADADLWFAEDPRDLERAKAMCAECPLRAQCLQAALDRAEAAERRAALAEAAITHGLTKDDLELLDGVPADKIEERAKKLAERLKKAAPPDASGREAGGDRGKKKATSLDSAVAGYYA